jgi:hypothetical protein
MLRYGADPDVTLELDFHEEALETPRERCKHERCFWEQILRPRMLEMKKSLEEEKSEKRQMETTGRSLNPTA